MWSVLITAIVFASAVGSCLAASGTVTTAMAVHGALMLTAWGLLMPAGGIAARYFKVTPGQDFPRVVENLTWWRWHRGLQYGGMALATAALGVILSETSGRFDTLHGRCGLVVMALGWLQVASGLLRGSKGGPTDPGSDPLDPCTWRGDHYDMTPRRHAFERWHKPAGWCAVIFAGVTILLGLQLVGSPVWLLFVVGVLQAGAVISVLDCAARRRWVDTYASLWGPDPRHPGDRRTSRS
ncbi:cytochrome b561 domain-containing protein [Lichenibacterium dinghuense]|uniref:cytochrome b561 domain-containing protein n=1 Tax=Lichenibacterium dinghuense TaxID=2895977 RepID=UPI001F325A74|nr:cytochrome b561 domain-containing protein [Lichenibacterium sp. 6Y81]